MEVVGRKCTDNASREKINLIDEIVDMCEKGLEECNECERMLDQADLWMGKRNKVSRLMVDRILTEDGHGEQWEKKKCSGHLALCVVEGRKDEDKKEETEELTSEVSFLLKDPVVFECVTRCCMTGEECADTALTHEMSAVMKVGW